MEAVRLVDTIWAEAAPDTVIDTLAVRDTVPPVAILLPRSYHGLHVTERGDSVRVTFHLTGKPFFTFDVSVHARDSIRVVWTPLLVPDLSQQYVMAVAGSILGALIVWLVNMMRKRNATTRT